MAAVASRRCKISRAKSRLTTSKPIGKPKKSGKTPSLRSTNKRPRKNRQLYNASIGLDPSGKPLPSLPKNLQRVMPMPVGPNYQATPQDQINHDYAVANFYRTHGDPYGNAEAYEARGAAMQKAVTEGAVQATITARDLALAGIRGDQEQANKAAPTYGDTHLSPYQRGELQLRTQPGGKPPTDEQVQDARAKWQKSFTTATSGTLKPKYPGPDGKPLPGTESLTTGKPPLVTAKSISDLRAKLQAARAQGYKGPLDPFSAIDDDSDPIALSRQLANMTGDPTLKTLLLERGKVASMQRRSQQPAPRIGDTDTDPTPDVAPSDAPTPPP